VSVFGVPLYEMGILLTYFSFPTYPFIFTHFPLPTYPFVFMRGELFRVSGWCILSGQPALKYKSIRDNRESNIVAYSESGI
jgi:hypothetical protein